MDQGSWQQLGSSLQQHLRVALKDGPGTRQAVTGWCLIRLTGLRPKMGVTNSIHRLIWHRRGRHWRTTSSDTSTVFLKASSSGLEGLILVMRETGLGLTELHLTTQGGTVVMAMVGSHRTALLWTHITTISSIGMTLNALNRTPMFVK